MQGYEYDHPEKDRDRFRIFGILVDEFYSTDMEREQDTSITHQAALLTGTIVDRPNRFVL